MTPRSSPFIAAMQVATRFCGWALISYGNHVASRTLSKIVDMSVLSFSSWRLVSFPAQPDRPHSSRQSAIDVVSERVADVDAFLDLTSHAFGGVLENHPVRFAETQFPRNKSVFEELGQVHRFQFALLLCRIPVCYDTHADSPSPQSCEDVEHLREYRPVGFIGFQVIGEEMFRLFRTDRL